MKTAGIKDIKNNLSRYLAEKKTGEEIMITERGRPIARIIKEHDKGNFIRQALAPLIERNMISMPVQPISRQAPARIETSGRSASDMAVEDRR